MYVLTCVRVCTCRGHEAFSSNMSAALPIVTRSPPTCAHQCRGTSIIKKTPTPLGPP